MFITNWKVCDSPHIEGECEFSFHCPIAPKWLMQFSLTVPRGFAFREVLISAPKSVKADSEAELGGRAKWKPFLNSNCSLPISEDDVIYYLPYGFRYYKSNTVSSHETDYFSFINIVAELFAPCSFIWRSPEIIQTTSWENKWEPHLSRPGVGNKHTVSPGWIV